MTASRPAAPRVPAFSVILKELVRRRDALELVSSLGMMVFFGILFIDSHPSPWVLLPPGLVMWIGFPLSWYLAWRDRRERGKV